jgi:hypothetical protein
VALITDLSPAQRARFPEFQTRWSLIARSTERADRPRSEGAIAGLYELAGLQPPPVVWLPCPLSAALSAMVHAGLIDARVDINHAIDAAVNTVVEADIREAISSAVRAAVSGLSRHGASKRADMVIDAAIHSANDNVVKSAATHEVASTVTLAMCPWMRHPINVAMGNSISFAASWAAEDVRRALWEGEDSMRYSLGIALGRCTVPWSMGPAIQAGMAFGASTVERCAAQDYFSEVLGLPVQRHNLDLIASCGHVWMLSDVCFATERCVSCEHDDRGRLHSGSAPAVRYASGWGLWFWHGVSVPRIAIDGADTLPVRRIEEAANVEVRRVMIERYGQVRFLRDAGATLVHEDERGKLWRKEMQGDEPLVMVQVRNATPEADGSSKEYFIRVPPYFSNASAAVAWTFGLTARTYRPHVES